MLLKLLGTFLVCACTLSVAACASTSSASLDQKFSLGVGDSATIAGENLKFKFLNVISDSRCPEGVTCIWAGEVSCLIQVTDKELKTTEVVLTAPGSSPGNKDITGYNIAFDVTPYPKQAQVINKGEYLLNMTVSKQ